MKRIVDLLKTFRNKRGSIVFLIEILMLALALINFLIPLSHYSFDGESFVVDAPEKSVVLDGLNDITEKGIYIDNALTGGEEVDIVSPKQSIHMGSYKVRIKVINNNHNNMISTHNKDGIYYPAIESQYIGVPEINNASDVVELNILTPIAIDDYHVTTTFKDGYMYFYGFEITETLWWKWIVLFGVAVISLVVNLFLWMKYKKSDESLRKALLLALIIGFSSLPLFGPGIILGQDSNFHIARLEALVQALRNGQIPSRIPDYWLSGKGYPSSVFYCDLFFVPFALLRILGCSIQGAYELYMVVNNIATTLIAFFSFRKIIKKDYEAIFASFLYAIAPYRLICLYTRGAIGEVTAYMFFPLVLYGVYKIYSIDDNTELNFRGRIQYVLPLVLGISSIVMSHVLSCIMVAFVGMIYALINIKRTFRKDVIINLLLAAVLSFTLCAWYLIPFLHEYTVGILVATNGTRMGEYQTGGAFLWQLFTLFSWGGTSNEAQNVVFAEKQMTEMSYSVGAAVVSIFMFVLFKFENKKADHYHVWIMSVLSVLMVTIYFPWNYIQRYIPVLGNVIKNIQFPWRFLGIAACFLALLSGVIYELICSDVKYGKVYADIFGVAIIALTLVNASYYMSITCKEASWKTVINDVYFGDKIMTGEYLPEEVDSESALSQFDPYSDEELNVSSYYRDKGNLYVNVTSELQEDTKLIVPILFYYGYSAIDVASNASLEILKSDTGYITVCVPGKYDGEIKIGFKEPIMWRISELISLMGIIMLALLFLVNRESCRRSWKRSV